jgi:diaminohydroxyphosphoribosylaminopyrimidine deaminase/5-amino-6-(5-phosphoribosylamino)uracil reductase
MNKHEFYMEKVLELAQKAEGHTSPNPMVGCVIVKNNRIISEGWHKKAGLPHAEAEALAIAGARAKGAALFVNLEPCCHTNKRTPPCAQAIIKAGIKTVVAAMADPNPHVAGRGFSMLKHSGIKVISGALEEQAKDLNRIYIKNTLKHTPYVIVKAGISIDGKIALGNGASKWITGKESLRHAQGLRRQCDAILAGINTVLLDNPYLDCRIDKSKKIKKIVLDSRGRTPLNANLFKNTETHDVFIAAPAVRPLRKKQLENAGINVIKSRTLKQLMHELFSSGITSVLVEGGSGVITSFMKEKLADEACFYIAPRIIGDDGIPFVGNLGFTNLAKTYTMLNAQCVKLGPDVLIKGGLKYVSRDCLLQGKDKKRPCLGQGENDRHNA